MKIDFTYIDDIVDGMISVLRELAKPNENWTAEKPDPSSSTAPFRLYKIGNNKPVELMSFISEIEKNLKTRAVIDFKEMQAGDVTATWANVDDLMKDFNYKPKVSIEIGLKNFIEWYKMFYKK